MRTSLVILVCSLVVTSGAISRRVGRISQTRAQVKELNPGPCTGFPPEGPSCCCGGKKNSWPSANRTCAEACPTSPLAVPCCCPGAFGPGCTTCPGSRQVEPSQPGNPYTLICEGHGVCDGGGSAEGSGQCYCSTGYTGADCKTKGPTPSYKELFPPLRSYLPSKFAWAAYVEDATTHNKTELKYFYEGTSAMSLMIISAPGNGASSKLGKFVLSTDGKTYQYDESGTCETLPHAGPFGPYPDLTEGFVFKEFNSEGSNSIQAHYISASDPAKQVWIQVGASWSKGEQPQGQLAQYMDPDIVGKFGAASNTMNFSAASEFSSSTFQLPFMCSDATVKGSVEVIKANIDNSHDSEFFQMAKSLYKGMIYSVAGADAGVMHRTCVKNCAAGELGKPVLYAQDAKLISYPQFLTVDEKTGNIFTSAEYRDSNAQGIIKVAACAAPPCKATVFVMGPPVQKLSPVDILVDGKEADTVWVVGAYGGTRANRTTTWSLFKAQQDKLTTVHTFNEETYTTAPRYATIDPATNIVYWTNGTFIDAFDISTKTRTNVCTDCGCQQDMTNGYSTFNSFAFDASSGKIVAASRWGVFMIDPSPTADGAARCKQGFASSSLVVAGAGVTEDAADALDNVILDGTTEGDMYSFYQTGYNDNYDVELAILHLSNVQ